MRIERARIGLVVLAGFVALGSVADGSSARIKERSPRPRGVWVEVVNPASRPVPTAAQGVTEVGGTVAATQAGGWQVDVGNTTANPVPVEIVGAGPDPGGESEGEWVSAGQCAPTSNFTGSVSIYTVPEGKRLLVEDMSVYASGNNRNLTGAEPTAIVWLRCGAGAYRRYFSVYAIEGFGNSPGVASGGDSVHFVVDGGQAIVCEHAQRSLNGGETCGWVTGRLVDFP
jgi:hypothetical protein